jgi:hypothetical protein
METPWRFGPVAMSATLTTNILNPGTTTGGVNCTGSPFGNLKVLLTHIKIVNKTSSPVTASLWLGATGANTAGTEWWVNATPVPANGAIDWWGEFIIYPADFLVGGAGAGTSLTIEGEGLIAVA